MVGWQYEQGWSGGVDFDTPSKECMKMMYDGEEATGALINLKDAD